MKVTITVDISEDRLDETLKQAGRIILEGGDEGTYGNPSNGEITIAYWPKGAKDCDDCGGRGHIVE